MYVFRDLLKPSAEVKAFVVIVKVFCTKESSVGQEALEHLICMEALMSVVRDVVAHAHPRFVRGASQSVGSQGILPPFRL